MSNNSEYKAFTDQWMQSWEYLDRNQKSMNAVFDMCFNNGMFHIVCSEIDQQYSKYKEELEKFVIICRYSITILQEMINKTK